MRLYDSVHGAIIRTLLSGLIQELSDPTNPGAVCLGKREYRPEECILGGIPNRRTTQNDRSIVFFIINVCE